LVENCKRGLIRRAHDGHASESASPCQLAVVLPGPWPRDQRDSARNTLVDGVVSRSSDHDIGRTVKLHGGPIPNPAFRRTSARALGCDTAHVVILKAGNHSAVPVEFVAIAGGAHENARASRIQAKDFQRPRSRQQFVCGTDKPRRIVRFQDQIVVCSYERA